MIIYENTRKIADLRGIYSLDRKVDIICLRAILARKKKKKRILI